MIICAAQTKPIKGNIALNIANHKKLIQLAIANKADIIIFPELSITGYEPTLAAQLATNEQDSRFDDFQHISDTSSITVGIGMPLKCNNGVMISMIIFQPNKPRQVYAKQHLHRDEYPWFVSGKDQVYLLNEHHKIAFAICYELSVPVHAAHAYTNGATMYIASVAKTATGATTAMDSLRHIAKHYALPVIMVNCTGLCDGEVCGGNTAAWNSKGYLAGKLSDTQEGILIMDTDTQQALECIL